MKQNLKLERIGGDYCGIGIYVAHCRIIPHHLGIDLLADMPKHRDWVAEITGRDPKYKYARSFLQGKVDYANSNSWATRGVYINYILESGHIYDVAAPKSWKNTERYFCTVTDDGEIIKINKDEVEEWLNARSE